MTTTLEEYQDRPIEKEAQKEGFTIKNKEMACWATKKIKHLQAEIDSNNELVQAEIDKVLRWQAEVNSPLTDSITFFECLLEQYIRDENIKDPKIKSIKLIDGTLKLVKQRDKLVCDDGKVLKYLKDHHYKPFVKSKIVETIDKIALKKHLAVNGTTAEIGNGNVIEGLTVMPQTEPKFSLKLK